MGKQKQKRGRGGFPDSGDDSEGGPRSPKVKRPQVDELIKRMRRVRRDQAGDYRQRTGE